MVRRLLLELQKYGGRATERVAVQDVRRVGPMPISGPAQSGPIVGKDAALGRSGPVREPVRAGRDGEKGDARLRTSGAVGSQEGAEDGEAEERRTRVACPKAR